MITCDKCAFCVPTPGGSLYCAFTDHFVPNIGCEDGKPIKKTTNADRIRAMSDEELADFLERWEMGDVDYSKTFCDLCDGQHYDCRDDCLMDWLKSPVEEVHDG